MQLVPIHEGNDCHEPAGSPQGGQFCSKGGGTAAVGVVPALTGRFGRTDLNEWSRSSLWYHFPEGGDYEATPVAQFSLGEIAAAISRADYEKGQAGMSDYFESLVPKAAIPPGHTAVFRIGSRRGGLSGRNAANARGLTEFIYQMTRDGDYSIEGGFELERGMRYLTVYAVKLGRTTSSGYTGKFTWAWGR